MRKTASIIRPSSWETTTNATTFFTAILALAFALPVGGWVVGACTAVATAFAARHLVQAIRERRTWTGLGVSFPIFVTTFMMVQMPLCFEETRRTLASSVLGFGAVSPHAQVSIGFIFASPWDAIIIAPFFIGIGLFAGLFVVGHWLRRPCLDDLDSILIFFGAWTSLHALTIYNGYAQLIAHEFSIKHTVHALSWYLNIILFIAPVSVASMSLGVTRMIARRRFFAKVLRGVASGYRLATASGEGVPALFRWRQNLCNTWIVTDIPPAEGSYRISGASASIPIAAVFIPRR